MGKIYTKGSTAVDEILAGAELYNILESGGGAFKSNMQINLATSVTQAGTGLTAARWNNVETGIDGLDSKVAVAIDIYQTGGSSTAFTLTTISPAPALATNEVLRVKFHTAAGATPTLNRDSKGAKLLKFFDGTGTKQPCSSTTIFSGMVSFVYYDGTDYIVMAAGVQSALNNLLPTLSTARKVLRINSAASGVEWGSLIVGQAKRVATQSIPNTTITDISNDTEVADTDNFINIAGAPTVFTIPYTGWYNITMAVTWANNGTGYRAVRILDGGTVLLEQKIPSLSGDVCSFAFGIQELLTSGHTIKADAYQNSGGALNLTSKMTVAFLGV